MIMMICSMQKALMVSGGTLYYCMPVIYIKTDHFPNDIEDCKTDAMNIMVWLA